jgi:hypothetical protein
VSAPRREAKGSACLWVLTLFPTLVFPAQVIESMTTGEPVVRVLAVLAVPLDVSLVVGGGPVAEFGRQFTQPDQIQLSHAYAQPHTGRRSPGAGHSSATPRWEPVESC